MHIDIINLKQYGFLAGFAAFWLFKIFIVSEQQKPDDDWDIYITHLTLLGVWFLWSVLFYAQRRLRLVEWSKRRDYGFFEMEHDDKLPRDVDAARGQQQAWSNRERRYMARLRRYKCSSVLARHIILVNIAAFHFATAARHKEYPFYVSLSDGLWLLLFLVVAQCLWWRFIRGDKIIKGPIHVMETSSRLLVDFEWLAALFVIPCSLLTYSLLSPTRGLLADEPMLYFSMLSVQVALFFIILYPGRIPARRGTVGPDVGGR